MKQICENCGKTIEKPETAYRLRIEIFADPEPPEFTEADLERDTRSELEELVRQMHEMDSQEAEEEVFESYLFTLCAACRRAFHDEFKRRHGQLFE